MSPVGRIVCVMHWETRSACGSAVSVPLTSLARSTVVGLSSLVRPPSSSGPTSLRACAIHGSAASIVAGVSLTPGRISLANARVFGNEALRLTSALSACVERRAELADRGLQVVLLVGQRAQGGVEVRDEALELGGVGAERLGDPRGVGDQAGEVVLVEAQERLVDDRRVLQRARRVVDRPVQRLGGRLALDVGVLRLVLGGGRLVGQRGAVAVEQPLEAVARVGLQRGQDLVELHGRGGLGRRDRVAVAQRRRLGRARREVDELVALEEDARPDLQRRVLVDRQAGLVDLHRDERQVAVAALVGRDLLDLADVHARDPDRRVGPDVVGVGEDGLDAEAVRERHVLGEAGVDDDRREHEHEQADRERVGPVRSLRRTRLRLSPLLLISSWGCRSRASSSGC